MIRPQTNSENKYNGISYKRKKYNYSLSRINKKMNKEIKYFKSIAKLVVKYSGKQSYDLSELKDDLKALKGGYKHLEGVVESVEGLINMRNDEIIHEMISRQKTLESNYQAIVQQQTKSPSQAPAYVSVPTVEIPKGAKEYSTAELQKICGYKSGQTLYNRINSYNLKLNKRKVGLKVFWQLSAEDLEMLKYGPKKSDAPTNLKKKRI